MADELRHVEIWPSASGITDLPTDWRSLAVPSVRQITDEWKSLLRTMDPVEASAFTERLNREWSIETGVIENLYMIERGVTQTLIEQGFQSALLEHGSVNRDPEYVLALLRDQKEALEGLFSFVKQERSLSVGYVKELHAAMTRSQPTTDSVDLQGNRVQAPMIHGDWKRQPNYPKRNGNVYLYCPPEQVAPEMERLVQMSETHRAENVAKEVDAAWLHHRFTQIHPFQDGNGRVARALSSLVLIRAGLFPMTVPRNEKGIYIESLERADRGDLHSLVLLIARRQEVAFLQAQEFARR